jgi:hypothetical protein
MATIPTQVEDRPSIIIPRQTFLRTSFLLALALPIAACGQSAVTPEEPKQTLIGDVQINPENLTSSEFSQLTKDMNSILQTTPILNEYWPQINHPIALSRQAPELLEQLAIGTALIPTSAHPDYQFRIMIASLQQLRATFPNQLETLLMRQGQFALMNEMGHQTMTGPERDITTEILNGPLKRFANPQLIEFVSKRKVYVVGATVVVDNGSGDIREGRRLTEMLNDAILRSSMSAEMATAFDQTFSMFNPADKDIYTAIIRLCIDNPAFAEEMLVMSRNSNLAGMIERAYQEAKTSLLKEVPEQDAEARAMLFAQAIFDNAFKANQ